MRRSLPLALRVGLDRVDELDDADLADLRLLGVADVQVNRPRLPGAHQWEFADLRALRQRLEAAGLRLAAIENVPVSFYDRIMLGQPGRDRQIEHMAATVRNLGRAGIPALGYHWMANAATMYAAAPPRQVALRGGAVSSRFDLEEYLDDTSAAPLSHGRVWSEDEMWAHYGYYLERILPVAEQAGVRLALHPDDPPAMPSLRGVARLFRDFSGFRRAFETFASPCHGLNFCVGCWSEMGAAGVLEAIRWFGTRGQIVYAHCRAVQGQMPCYTECFIDEGTLDLLAVVRTFREAGFEGVLFPDHVPQMDGDSPWGHRGRAYAVGYLKALVDLVAGPAGGNSPVGNSPPGG